MNRFAFVLFGII